MNFSREQQWCAFCAEYIYFPHCRRPARDHASGACLFLVGCADEPSQERETGSIATSSTSAAPAQTRSSRTTVVRPGDTLFSIARRNNVTVYDLATSNNLSSTRLQVGQTLSVPSY